MNDIGEMLTKAVEGVTRQFNAQVEASIAMLVNLGIPLERIELINRTTDDMSVVTEVRSRTSDEAQAVKDEREATAGWLKSCAAERIDAAQGMSYMNGRFLIREAGALTHTAQAIRNGDHLKEEA